MLFLQFKTAPVGGMRSAVSVTIRVSLTAKKADFAVNVHRFVSFTALSGEILSAAGLQMGRTWVRTSLSPSPDLSGYKKSHHKYL